MATRLGISNTRWNMFTCAGMVPLGSALAVALVASTAVFAETNAILRVNAEFVYHRPQEKPVYVSGEPIRIRSNLTNATDQPIAMKWCPKMFCSGNVRVWRVNETGNVLLSSHTMETLPRVIPTTTITERSAIVIDSDVVELYSPADCIFASPASLVLYEPGEYIMQVFFSAPAAGGQQPGTLECSSEKLSFRVIPLELKTAQSLLVKVTDNETSMDARVRLATLLMINLDGKDRNDLIRRCIGDSEMEMRMLALVGCGRYRIKEFAPTIRKLIEKDEEEDVRANALFALGAMDPVGSVPVLIQCAEQRKDGDRRAAIQKLGELGDRRALPPLQKILGEKNLDEDTRDLIRRTVKSIESR